MYCLGDILPIGCLSLYSSYGYVLLAIFFYDLGQKRKHIIDDLFCVDFAKRTYLVIFLLKIANEFFFF